MQKKYSFCIVSFYKYKYEYIYIKKMANTIWIYGASKIWILGLKKDTIQIWIIILILATMNRNRSISQQTDIALHCTTQCTMYLTLHSFILKLCSATIDLET